jgi:hypothetical protein
MRETYAPTILERKTRRLRKETGNPNLRSKLDSGLSPKDLFLFSIVRPTKMLIFSPICLTISVYLAVYVSPAQQTPLPPHTFPFLLTNMR